MAITKLWAGSSTPLTELPSPISVKPSMEIIWSENTGRAQSGANKATMIGDVVAEKITYAIEWDMLTATEFSLITSKLKAGFFYFDIGTSAPSSPSKFYRSEISYKIQQITASDLRYRNVAVSVIQQ